jgi:predicted transcriptional regulator
MDEDVTPEELAKALGLSGRTIRAYLRSDHSTGHLHGQRWHLTPSQADAVRARFAATGR